MARIQHRAFKASRMTQFAQLSPAEDGTESSFVIPDEEALATKSRDELRQLHEQAAENFNTIYGGGANELSQEDMDALEALTVGLESLSAEIASREEAEAERREAAAKLAERAGVRADEEDEDDEDEEKPEGSEGSEDDEEEEDEEDDADEAETPEAPEGGAVTASSRPARREVRVPMATVARHLRRSTPESSQDPKGIRDVLRLASSVQGFNQNAGLDWDDAGVAFDRALGSMNLSAFEAAQRANRHESVRVPMFSVTKPTTDELTISSYDGPQVEEVLANATSAEKQEALVAAGGWCAPSETVYTLLELETRDGIFDLPEVTLKRGGIRRSLGPNFADLFASVTGFSYTEAQDIAGQYGTDANGVGNDTDGEKPCIEVDCPEFEEFRLGVQGLCVTAGILQSRGFPEAVARFIRGAYIAHDHRVAAATLAEIARESQKVQIPGTQAGAAAPVLTALELRAQVLRQKTRMGRNAVLEVVAPAWLHGAIRADLSRRLGVNLLNVTDAEINAWFTARRINAQFVYNWQELGTSATVTEFPTTAEFLMYPAGTWVRGTNSLVTIENLYDSVKLGHNNYTALFTEEGTGVIRMGHESDRVVVPIEADGATHMGIDIAHNGTKVTAEPGA